MTPHLSMQIEIRQPLLHNITHLAARLQEAEAHATAPVALDLPDSIQENV
jgi:hypothetical protein